MKIDIRKENNEYIVADEFGLITETFKTYDEAYQFVMSKISGGDITRLIMYVRKGE